MSNNPQLSDKIFSWKDGRHWFDVGIVLFKQVKNYWYISCMILAVMISLVSNIAIGLVPIVIVFASPIITAFMMNACHKKVINHELVFASLWRDVVQNINGFLLLGLISAALSVISHHLHIQLLHIFSLPVELTQAMAAEMTGREALLRAVLNIVTNLPIALALAFSPALILFKTTQPVVAVKYSVMGVAKSWKAFVIMMLLFLLLFFGIVLLASFVTAIIMTVLGPGSQTLINVIILFFAITAAGIGLCAQYQAYTEVYQHDSEDDQPEGGGDDTKIYAEI